MTPSSDAPQSRSQYTVIPQEYPMYAMHVADFLQQSGTPRPHQDLLADGLLKRIEDADRHNLATAPIVFLSHQWLSASSPDAELRQIGVLQRVLRRMAAGEVPDVDVHYAHQLLYPGHDGGLGREEMKVLGTNSYIWYDFFSVPQPGYGGDDETKGSAKGAHGTDHRVHGTAGALLEGLLGAVRSIPAYMEQSSHMVVLAPTCPHADNNEDGKLVCDLRTWRRRGWCRLELQVSLRSCEFDCMCLLSIKSLPVSLLLYLYEYTTYTFYYSMPVITRLSLPDTSIL